MRQSDSIKNIATAMVGFQQEMETIFKKDTNPFFKSKYAALPEILKAIKDPLVKQGLSFMQFPKGDCELETIVMHISGEWIAETFYMRPAKQDPQGYGSVITYQRRYAIGAIFGLSIDEDDDGNKGSKPEITTDNRPWLSERQLASAKTRLTEDASIEPRVFVDKIYSEFKISREYRKQLEDLIK